MATTTERYGRIKAKRLAILNLGEHSATVVGVTAKNRPGAIDLLAQNDAGEPMRQGHVAEGKDPIGLKQGREPEAVRASNEEGKTLGPAVAKLCQHLRKILASEVVAAPIEANQLMRGGKLGEKAFGFGFHACLRGGSFGFRNLYGTERRETDLPADRLGTVEILRKQLAFRPLPELANGDDQEPHGSPLP